MFGSYLSIVDKGNEYELSEETLFEAKQRVRKYCENCPQCREKGRR